MTTEEKVKELETWLKNRIENERRILANSQDNLEKYLAQVRENAYEITLFKMQRLGLAEEENDQT